MAEILHVGIQNGKTHMMLCHGAYDTLIDKPGSQYKTITLPEIAAMVQQPQATPKKQAAFVIASEYNHHDGRSHDAQRQMGRYHMMCFDIDEGSPSLDDVSSAIEKIIGDRAYMVYSSASSSAENMKWRVLVPLAAPIYGTDYSRAQIAAFDLMKSASGIICDAALSRPGQPVYLPNIPPERRDEDGQPLFYQHKLVRKPSFDYYDSIIEQHAEMRRQQEEDAAEQARQAAEKRATERQQRRNSVDDDVDPIEEFNGTHTVSDMLLRYGYDRLASSKSYRSPYQTSGSYATKDFGDHWVSLSGSDASAGLGAQKAMGEMAYCWGDAFDLYAHFEHGGDMTKAVREYAAELRGPTFDQPTDPLADFDIVQFVGEDDQQDKRDEYLSVDEPEEASDPFEAVQPPEADIPDPVTDAPEESIWPTPVTQFDSSILPRRRWVYGYDYIRGYVSVTASAGGIGKTSMAIVEALSIVTGKPLLGVPVKEQANVWIVNLEDPRVELEMRVLAAMQHYGIQPEDVRGRLFMDGEDTFSVTLAAEGRDGIVTNDAMLEMMIRRIKENSIGVVVADPFVSMHTVNENSNSGVQAVVAMIRKLARDTDTSINLIHHVRKGGGEDASIDSVRGAGALIGAARCARVVNRVPEDQATELGFKGDDVKGVFRVDDGKSNLAPPAEAALYRRMKGVQLDNGEWVGVTVPLELPNAFDGISARDARRVQDAVAGAEANEQPFAFDIRNKNWVGHAVADALDLDVDDDAGKARIKKIISTWLATDVLRKEKMFSKRDGRDVPSVIVGEWITPEQMEQ